MDCGRLRPTLIQDWRSGCHGQRGGVFGEAIGTIGEGSFLGTRSHDVVENTMTAETMQLESHDVYENKDVSVYITTMLLMGKDLGRSRKVKVTAREAKR